MFRKKDSDNGFPGPVNNNYGRTQDVPPGTQNNQPYYGQPMYSPVNQGNNSDSVWFKRTIILIVAVVPILLVALIFSSLRSSYSQPQATATAAAQPETTAPYSETYSEQYGLYTEQPEVTATQPQATQPPATTLPPATTRPPVTTQPPATTRQPATAAYYNVTLKIESVKNMMFSKYDIIVYHGSKYIGTIKNGKEATFNIRVPKGKCTIYFYNSEDPNINSGQEFNVDSDKTYSCTLFSFNDSIDIEDARVKNSVRRAKNGFNPTTNRTIKLGSCRVQVPSYWEMTLQDSESFFSYAESEDFAILDIYTFSLDDTKASFEMLDSIKYDEDVIEAFAPDEFFDYVSCELYNNGKVKGYLYTYNGELDFEHAVGKSFVFTSPKDNLWCVISFAQSDESEYDYLSDFEKIIQSAETVK